MPGTILRCEYGDFRLGLAGPVLTAEADALRSGDFTLGLRLTLTCDPSAGRFSLETGDGRVAWSADGRPLPREAWLPVASAVLRATESHIASNPRLSALAEVQALALDARSAPAAERPALLARAASARRRTLGLVG